MHKPTGWSYYRQAKAAVKPDGGDGVKEKSTVIPSSSRFHQRLPQDPKRNLTSE